MWQLKVNGVLMPTIYYYIQDAYKAWDEEKARGVATYCEIVPVQTNQSLSRMWKSSKIIQLINDNFRKTFQGGKVVLTRGIRALPKMEIAEIMLKVSKFNDFTVANDPYEEHDYGSFEYHGNKIIWKNNFDIILKHPIQNHEH